MRTIIHSLVALLCLQAASTGAAAPFVMHFPDGGAPPWLFLTPGASQPAGLVADLLEATARQAGRSIRYEFQPRESSSASLQAGSAQGALFFGVTRPAAKDVLLSEPLLRMDTVLVTLRERPVDFRRPLDLANRRLCTLTDESYPPLTLLAMNNTLLQRKAKTEQAQLMMLRNEDCVAAVLNGPMFRWLSARYRWDNLRVEPQPLLQDNLRIGFAAGEAKMHAALEATARRLRSSGEFDTLLARHLPGFAHVSLK